MVSFHGSPLLFIGRILRRFLRLSIHFAGEVGIGSQGELSAESISLFQGLLIASTGRSLLVRNIAVKPVCSTLILSQGSLFQNKTAHICDRRVVKHPLRTVLKNILHARSLAGGPCNELMASRHHRHLLLVFGNAIS